jgi:hypothetical protein
VLFAALPSLIVHAAPREETASALGFYQVTRYVGFSIGSGVSVTLGRAFSDGTPTVGTYRATFLVVSLSAGLVAAGLWRLGGR